MEKNLIIAMLVISVFVFITAASSLYVEIHVLSGNVCGCVIPIWLFIPLLASLGLFIGALSFSLVKPQDRKSPPEKINEIILKFIKDEKERAVMRLLLERKKIKQNEISRVTGLNKVSVHRILKKFELMGIVQRKKKGKVVEITLVKFS